MESNRYSRFLGYRENGCSHFCSCDVPQVSTRLLDTVLRLPGSGLAEMWPDTLKRLREQRTALRPGSRRCSRNGVHHPRPQRCAAFGPNASNVGRSVFAPHPITPLARRGSQSRSVCFRYQDIGHSENRLRPLRDDDPTVQDQARGQAPRKRWVFLSYFHLPEACGL